MDDTIAKFASPAPIAVVGATDETRKFGGYLYRELKRQGYRVYPVNARRAEVDGDRAYRSLRDIPDDVEGAVVAIRPDRAGEVVADALARGIRRIWFQQGADFTEAARTAREAGMETVVGKCILMYAGKARGVHRFHAVLARLFGRY
ncbi:MAG TPA: CoA-binding protein [candidate division Zixibacteria bacterium]|nr:CoA-binding protein [candidate division Zixibacteria bacterium]MDD4918630.1 CoA-binding protein [candidate division Zixibacteria bacterium]MDM7972002.1 CoA-binding protein [candidate division Zixibacteria bacterium]HOD66061.1 CoA-binding protein [candidate division Zixibacteria bacterium]HPC10983.1 CoA-binding protein [candidate division Zixibacteria bacterium]